MHSEDLRTAPSQENLWGNSEAQWEEGFEPCPSCWTQVKINCILYPHWGCRQHDLNIISDLIKNGDFSPVTSWDRWMEVHRCWHIVLVWSMKPDQVMCRLGECVVYYSLLMVFKSLWPHGCLLTNHWRMQAASCHSCTILYFTWLNNSQQQETESRQGCATITKPISEVFGKSKQKEVRSVVEMTGEHHALVQTSTFLSSLGPPHSNLLKPAQPSCSLLPHYPIPFTPLSGALLLSFLISVPVTSHGSPASKSYCYSPDLLCLSFPKPKWGLRGVTSGKIQPNQLQLCQSFSKLFLVFYEKYRLQEILAIAVCIQWAEY